MYYRLKDGFILRGWEKMNAVLVKRPKNQIKVLNPQEFNLLSLCDGETDFTDIPLSEEEAADIARFLEKGYIEKLSEPRTLDGDQQYYCYPNRYVQSCFWSLTGKCNFRCRHCYMDAPEGALGELSHEEAISLIDQMAECGVLRVDITGGEPFVRKDFWELVEYIKRCGMVVSMVYTNGWLLTEEVLDRFESLEMRPVFSISFDGLGWHDWMRGINGAEEAALNALTLCKRRGFPMNVEMCVHRGNLPVFRETVNRLAELGVPALKCSNVTATPLWLENSEGNSLSQQEYTDAMLEYIPHFFEDGMPMDLVICDVAILWHGSAQYEVVAEKRDGTEKCLDCHLCGSARSSCYITPEGQLLPCMPMISCEGQEKFARFQDIGLRESLSSSFYMQFVDGRVRDLLAVNKKCRECEYRLKCAGGCRASAVQQTGDLMGEDLNQCFLWENGYVEKIHRAADEAIKKYVNREGTENEN